MAILVIGLSHLVKETHMDISVIIDTKYEGKSSFYHRALTDDPTESVLASGYIKKYKNHSDNIDFVTNEYHGILILNGTCDYNDDTHTIHCVPGDFIQRVPGLKHSTIITSDEFSELYIAIGKSIYKDLLKINVLSDHSPVLHPGIDYETVQSILHIHDQLSYVNRLELPLLLPQFIQYLTRITYLARTNRRTDLESEILSMAVIYIQQNIKKRITGEDVAAHVNMGYEKFRKLFTKHYNISPGNYIILKRIEKSQQMLSKENTTITEISYELGYTDVPSFSKQFKKTTGRTPSDFQRLFIHH